MNFLSVSFWKYKINISWTNNLSAYPQGLGTVVIGHACDSSGGTLRINLSWQVLEIVTKLQTRAEVSFDFEIFWVTEKTWIRVKIQVAKPSVRWKWKHESRALNHWIQDLRQWTSKGHGQGRDADF